MVILIDDVLVFLCSKEQLIFLKHFKSSDLWRFDKMTEIFYSVEKESQHFISKLI